MSYLPQLQPPPQLSPEQAELNLWLKRTYDTLNEFIVKERINGWGLIFDEIDNRSISYSHVFFHSKGP